MYYITETRYAGPNPEQNIDSNIVDITTEPLRNFSSGEVILSGCAGTYNDWTYYAHGRFSTLKEARKEIKIIFGKVRESDDECPDSFNVSSLFW